MNHWYEINCGHAACKARNFIDNGDPSDMTVRDVEAFVCWKCERFNIIDGDGLAEIGDDDGDLNTEDGKEFCGT